MDVVIFGLARWDGDYSSTTLSLAKALSKQHRVFYIDNPFTLNAYFKDRKHPRIKKRSQALLWGKNTVVNGLAEYPNLYMHTPPLVLPLNWLPKGGIYLAAKKINDYIVRKSLKKLKREFNIQAPWYINIFNPFYPVKWPCKEKNVNIYYTVDKIENSEYINKHGPYLERIALKKSDFALATSKKLQSHATCYRTTYYLPNAADIELFSKAAENAFEKPKDLSNENREIIIYTGNFSIREDFELINKLSKDHPSRLILLIGPVNTKRHLEYDLEQRENVIFTGPKSLQELPAYLQHAHCAIIPFLCNELTSGIYPLKINEYLASGIPVVSTPFSEDIKGFQEVISLASTPEDFSEAIDREIKSDNAEKRQNRVAFSAKNNWDNRALQLQRIIEEHLAD
ncbi:glycosyltransferase [Luteibaculum oceani]|uniref:Glycosyltransferase family 1 protein n=1 Tax=Luteibaculum oceani TaxID=1294296 RepID=A0A5C6V4F8_9FLAO|nr:glycosyltransferase [Luteibaculum oceani]TXC78628.1 glycosyltransferase family 1 protein [Luteibaculum oceani]